MQKVPFEPRPIDQAEAIAQIAIAHVTHPTVPVSVRADVIAGLLSACEMLRWLQADNPNPNDRTPVLMGLPDAPPPG